MSLDFRKFLSKRTELLKESEIRELLKLTEGRDIISLAGGLPDPSTFPRDKLASIAQRVIEDLGDKALQYSPTPGVTPFRRVLTTFLERNRVKVRGDDDLIVTAGSQEALYLLAKAVIDPGDYVLVEAPTYLAAINVFREYGAKFISAPVDDEGMNVHVLEERAKKAVREGARLKLIYTIPTCQNPSGVTLSRDRRKHLMELAEDLDLLIVEDDPYSFFSFEPIDAEHLKTMDLNGRVIYIGTLSKILSPGLRIGWALGPSWLIRTMELAKQTVDLHSSTLSQYVAMEAIREGVVDETIERAKRLYKMKRDVMLEALEEYFPEGSRWTKPAGGLFVFAYAPEGIDTKKLLPEAIDRGVAYVPGASFFVEGGGQNTMRLNFSYPPPELIREGIKRLGSLLREKIGSR
ncbi:MAG: PLP-dependent aminotransferase family protein [Desulfurococcales archaeon]|nr:PLP-dependent aminotransferase family protein [Desulfurococcales archaeon]